MPWTWKAENRSWAASLDVMEIPQNPANGSHLMGWTMGKVLRYGVIQRSSPCLAATYAFLILRLIPPHNMCNAAWPCWLQECQIRRAGEQWACLGKIWERNKKRDWWSQTTLGRKCWDSCLVDLSWCGWWSLVWLTIADNCSCCLDLIQELSCWSLPHPQNIWTSSTVCHCSQESLSHYLVITQQQPRTKNLSKKDTTRKKKENSSTRERHNIRCTLIRPHMTSVPPATRSDPPRWSMIPELPTRRSWRCTHGGWKLMENKLQDSSTCFFHPQDMNRIYNACHLYIRYWKNENGSMKMCL